MEKNRVLVISVSSWNEKVGSNTWKELLSFLDDSKIGCITFRPGLPEKKYSKNYLIYDENKIIKSIFSKKIVPCYSFKDDNNSANNVGDALSKLYKNKERFVFLKRMIREIVWKLSKWRNRTLDHFVTQFNPTHIVYFMDGYIHVNRICRYIKKITNAKTIGYFVDDTFSFKQRNNLLFFIHRFFQRQSIKKMVKSTDCFWSINSRMQDEVKKTFKINSSVITKPLREVNACYFSPNKIFPLKVLYAGNLGIGRSDSLSLFINSLKTINKDFTYFKLDVFSNYVNNKNIDETYISFHKPIPQEEIYKKYKDSDILLFLESVRRSSAKIARLSFSTKITDYLSYCKPIIAIGSPDCFPISYLTDNNAAIFGKTEQEITEALMHIVDDVHMLDDYASNAFELGMKNHNRELIAKTVRGFFN